MAFLLSSMMDGVMLLLTTLVAARGPSLGELMPGVLPHPETMRTPFCVDFVVHHPVCGIAISGCAEAPV